MDERTEFAVSLPAQYSKPYPIRVAREQPCHDLTVFCNGKMFRRIDFSSEKEWREAGAHACGFTNAVWEDPEDKNRPTKERVF